jgi:hypothetical protein
MDVGSISTAEQNEHVTGSCSGGSRFRSSPVAGCQFSSVPQALLPMKLVYSAVSAIYLITVSSVFREPVRI